jgi:hypothetical protein
MTESTVAVVAVLVLGPDDRLRRVGPHDITVITVRMPPLVRAGVGPPRMPERNGTGAPPSPARATARHGRGADVHLR